MRQIRNFAIIAHIDHGKSTLADRLLELTGTVKKAQAQQLDSNPIEQERGITIKLAPVQMQYQLSGQQYLLNLVDTPGHVDFRYEVSRALAACEGALLLVDATQGVQAQTLAHFRLAKQLGLTMIPVINKIDLATAEVDKVASEMQTMLGFDPSEISLISAKSGQGIDQLLDRIVTQLPGPETEATGELQALVFNSDYLPHQGVRLWIRLMSGELKTGEKLKLLGSTLQLNAVQLGVFCLPQQPVSSLSAGEIGYVITGAKQLGKIRAGDTLTTLQAAKQARVTALPGYQPAKPVVYLSFYPLKTEDYGLLSKSLQKLKLMDASLQISNQSSPYLGHGFRIGFLGLLHAEVVQQRLEEEFQVAVMATQPNIDLRIQLTDNSWLELNDPSKFPDPVRIKQIQEPVVEVEILVPDKYVGKVIPLLEDKRGQMQDMRYIDDLVRLNYRLPLLEMMQDFFNQLKSVSSGYASLDYQPAGWQTSDLVKLQYKIAGDVIEVFSQIVHRQFVETTGRQTVEKLCQLIPRQQFEVAVQAVVGSKVIARGNIKPFRKDVTAKLYGGDQTRKDKLLKKQKKGKKRLKQLGRVSIPQDLFWKLQQA